MSTLATGDTLVADPHDDLMLGEALLVAIETLERRDA